MEACVEFANYTKICEKLKIVINIIMKQSRVGAVQNIKIFSTLHVAIVHNRQHPLVLFTLSISPSFSFSSLSQRIPLWYKMAPRDAVKFPASVWKVLIYSILWFWALLIIHNENYFFHLNGMWEGNIF